MTLHVHSLTGCSPTPLAHYLKALGILRVVSEQVDPSARGWWKDEHFCLLTSLDDERLVDFLADEYRPTPLVAPWNGSSGFYPKDAKRGITAVAASQGPRFNAYRRTIAAAKRLVDGRSKSPKNDEKRELLAEIRRTWRDPVLAWISAALVLDEELTPHYPAVLGTGGNDGRLDFTNNFMQRLCDLLDLSNPECQATASARHLLIGALRADSPIPGLTTDKIGYFYPGAAGGANASSGFAGDSLVNPWDFVLMLEGAILFSAGLTRRADTNALALASAPFAIRSSASGFATASSTEGAGGGEQWLPIWNAPSTLADLRAMFSEARCQSGRRPASRTIDAARALARHGSARGITAFERVGYLKRLGESNLAVPLGRWKVSEQPHSGLTDHAARWIDAFGRSARSPGGPSSWQRAARRCDEALLMCSRRANDPSRWYELMVAMGDAERLLSCQPASAGKARLRPLSRLPGEWLQTLDQGSEGRRRCLRLAWALAGQVGLRPDGSADYDNPVRCHWVPFSRAKDGRLERSSFASTAGPEVVATRGDLQQNAVRILRRRLHRRTSGRFPLTLARRSPATLDDIAAFLRGDVDDALIWALARPLAAVDARDADPVADGPFPSRESVGQLGAYGLLRLAHLPGAVTVDGVEHEVICDPSILPRLLSGQGGASARIAAARLRQSGLRPHLATLVGGERRAHRLATALLFAITDRSASMLARALTHPSEVFSEVAMEDRE